MVMPALLVTEAVTWTHAVINGPRYVHSKLKAYYWVLRNSGKIIKKRPGVRAYKKITDSEFLELIDPEIPFAQVISSRVACNMASAVINSFYKAHFRLLKRLV
jgi:hypothetical protein